MRVGLPHVSEGGDFPSHGVEHPIDERLTQEWSKWGLKASPRAETQSLVRRLFFDLAGQLPLPEEAREWSQKLDQPNGYEQLVDFLLASPRFRPSGVSSKPIGFEWTPKDWGRKRLSIFMTGIVSV